MAREFILRKEYFMSISGIGANGQVPQNIDTKKIAQEAGKGTLKGGLSGAIGNILNGSSKAEAMEHPMKGWTLEYTGTGNVSGEVTESGTAVNPEGVVAGETDVTLTGDTDTRKIANADLSGEVGLPNEILQAAGKGAIEGGLNGAIGN